MSIRALELRIPPLVLVSAAALAMWLSERWMSYLNVEWRGQNVLALTVAMIGVMFCIVGVLQFYRAHTTTNPMKPVASTALVTEGVYRLTRNPMYLGFALILLGWAMFLGNILSFLVLAGFVFYLNRFQIIPEERALNTIFGPKFEAYCRKVRRWI